MKCNNCGKEFTQTHHTQKYCSDECRRIVGLYQTKDCAKRRKYTKPGKGYKGDQCKHKDCIYKSGTRIMGTYPCEYMLITGFSRGCEAKDCNKYIKRKKSRKNVNISLGV